ncbi:tetratricopeptide repeat-containing glycosyltransferase family 2 protein [Clostridium hydrogeniformans]|uniref:tetratricopeptide repeat-containing glycosyltransferase family 2 protein n=1 Tax=Clostridium hydrogeniformans TaxID=349933 RepID=UPI00068BF8B3|nr:glycosyltransferase family 2 protein [Clostridium hydrogeniformans]
MDRFKTLSLCMIVKNEENHLYRCLNSVKDLVDEIIIVDTGSTDKTIEIAKKFGAIIYHYKWDNSFSNARNFSLSKASKEWILLMDADDEFSSNHKEKFIELLNEEKFHVYFFKTLSYTGNGEGDTITNLNPRLLINNGEYKFFGDIHEQLNHISGDWNSFNHCIRDINIYHYGYLTKVIEEKNKRKRNIEIILNELSKDPESEFHIFNLATEYFANGEIDKALYYYDRVYKNIDVSKGYSPKTIIRKMYCLCYLKRYDEALNTIEDGLKIYPNYTDLEFERGNIYLILKKYTLAIESYKRALELGEPPSNLEFFKGCGTFKPAIELGKLYEMFRDYKKALSYYLQAFKFNQDNYLLLYNIGAMINKSKENKEEVPRVLSSYFNLENSSSSALLGKILIKEKLYDSGEEYIDRAEKLGLQGSILYLLKGQLNFYRKKYDNALEYLNKINEKDDEFKEGIKYISLIYLIKGVKINEDILENIKNKDGVLFSGIKQIEEVLNGGSENYILENKMDEALEILINLYRDILRTGEFEILERAFYALNYIERDSVLYALGKLYYSEGINAMALKEFIRSIRELNYCNEDMIRIMFQCI